jgi:uncharacterized protein
MKRRLWLQSMSIAVGVLFSGFMFSSGMARGDEVAKAPDGSGGVARMLMATQATAYEHDVVKRKGADLSIAERAITQLGISSGLFRVDCTRDVAKDFNKEKLANYDLVLFYTQGDPPVAKDALEYFCNDWIKQKGHGFIGIHPATDTFKEVKSYWDMIGGTFNGHPWQNGSKITVTVHDTQHPAMKPWGDEFQIADEIYRFKNWQPDKVRVLMSMNMAKTAHKEAYHVPLAWCKEVGQGKVFYISLGHDEKVWANPKYIESLHGAVKWVLNKEPGDATPNPELSKAQEDKAKADVAAAKAGK